MRLPRAPTSHAVGVLALLLLVATAAGALAACGGSETALTASTPRTWLPGASPTPAVMFPAGGTPFVPDAGDYGTTGWEFKPTLDINVTHLGYYDDRQDGLLHPHRVGVFDTADKKLLFSVTVQPQSPLDGVYRWEQVEPPATLTAGHSYVVASEDGPAPYEAAAPNMPEGLVLAPEIVRGKLWAVIGAFKYPAPIIKGYFIPIPDFKFKPFAASSPTP